MNANQDLIEKNIPLVYVVIREYYPFLINDEDIIQCGMLGLCKAADKWREGTFSSYAKQCIKNEIRNELRLRQKFSVEVSLEKILEEDRDEY